MDLGIAGKWALVCGASKGLGRGCAEALAAEGVNVLLVARGADVLAVTAAAIAQASPAAQVRHVAADITTPEGRAAVFAAAALLLGQTCDLAVVGVGLAEGIEQIVLPPQPAVDAGLDLP